MLRSLNYKSICGKNFTMYGVHPYNEKNVSKEMTFRFVNATYSRWAIDLFFVDY